MNVLTVILVVIGLGIFMYLLICGIPYTSKIRIVRKFADNISNEEDEFYYSYVIERKNILGFWVKVRATLAFMSGDSYSENRKRKEIEEEYNKYFTHTQKPDKNKIIKSGDFKKEQQYIEKL